MPDQQASGPLGLLDPENAGTDYTSQLFIMRQFLSTVHTAQLVVVKAVTNAGGVAPVGFVDVLPLVSQLDGADNALAHATIFNVPYFRLQGGANAVIIDPKVGDIGVAVFAERDISQVKINKATSRPGSKRKHDMADGLYMGGFLNGAPAQYVRFGTDGIEITSPTAINLNAPTINLNGNIGANGGSQGGTMTLNNNVNIIGTLTNNSKLVGSTHTHGGVQTGGGTTGVPT
jgi:Phage protein Gp138 N-terminal domain/GpV Apex motif